MSDRGRPSTLTDSAVIGAVARRGGVATRRELVRDLGVSDKTIARKLAELVRLGILDDIVAGRVALADSSQLQISEEGREIVSALRDEGLDAHLTGFDLLANRAQQFIFEFPHLVYSEPYAYDATENALVQREFVVIPARSASSVKAPNQSRLVMLREQSEAERRYGVTANLAPLEKAWVDLFREVKSGDFRFDIGEVKQLLIAIIGSGADYEKILRYASRLRLKKAVEQLRNEAFHGRSG